MIKLVTYPKVRIGDQMLHDGTTQPVENVETGKTITSITLPGVILSRANSSLACIVRATKPRSRPAVPPLTAKVEPSLRSWVEAFSLELGIKPQDLAAIAIRVYKESQEAPAPQPVPIRRTWWGRRKRAA